MKPQPKEVDPNSDDAIGEMLASHPGLIDVVRETADRAVKRCNDLYQAPRQWIAWRLQEFQSLARSDDQISRYRNLKAAADFFTAFAGRYERARDLQALRVLHAELEREMEQDRLRRHNQARPVAAPAFDARGFVEGLAGRGVVMVVDREGGLSAMPTTKLSEQDRAIIRLNRSAVASAVSSLTATF